MASLKITRHTRLPLFTLALTIAIGCLSPIAIAVPASENAALRYLRIWSYIDTTNNSEYFQLVSGYDGVYDPEFNHANEGEPPVTSRDLLSTLGPFIEGLIEATEFPASDFGVDYHKGVDAMLPHLSPMRQTARLLTLDAKRLFSEGEMDAATERLAAALRLSQHATGDTTLINALVSVACFALVDDEIAANIEIFSAENRKTLRDALHRFDNEDPFGCFRAIRSEAQFVGGWMVKRIDHEWSTPESFGADVSMLMDSSSDPNEVIRAVYRGDLDDHEAFRTSLRTQLDQYFTAMHLIADAWNTPDAQKSLEAIGQRITDGSFGAVAQVMAPALSRAHRSDMQMRTRLHARLEWASN